MSVGDQVVAILFSPAQTSTVATPTGRGYSIQPSPNQHCSQCNNSTIVWACHHPTYSSHVR
jgi:hypothetical protein